MRDAIDFGEIVDNIRSYSSPVGESPTQVETQEKLIDTLTGLIHDMEMRDYDPQKCQFYMHPKGFDNLRDTEYMLTYGPAQSDHFRGRPIKTHHTMPRGVILFAAPDAIGLGGKVYLPEMIAYAELD